MKNHANNKKAYFSIKQTIALTFVAMAGLLAGYYFLLGGTRVFHEIKYQPKVILDSILSDDSVQVDPLLSKCINDPKCNNDSLEKDTMLHEVRYRRYLLKALSDSDLSRQLFNNQLFINVDSFNDSCLISFTFSDTLGISQKTKHRKLNKTQPILWDYYISYSWYYNMPVRPFHTQKKIQSIAKSFATNMEFFTDYPGFLLWTLLIILQFSMFPALILCAWMIIADFKKRFSDIYAAPGKKSMTLRYVVFSAFIIGLYVVSSYFAFFNPTLINNELFYRKMNSILLYISSIVAIAGITCFTGYLLISGTPISDGYSDNNKVARDDVILLNEMNRLFTNLLIISSIILCIVVLTTGSLYTSINSMDFIQKIANDLGYSPLAYHYVYLIAALCTILLLLFFIPAKLRLMDMERRIKEINPEESRLDKPSDIAGILKSIIIVGLPIITGIIHNLITMFTNN